MITLKYRGPRHSLIRAILLLGFLANSAEAQQQEVLTNETVVSMTKAHLQEQTIIDMIQSDPGKFVVTSSALIALKQQGVSDRVISAMRAKMRGSVGATPAARPATPTPSSVAPNSNPDLSSLPSRVWVVPDSMSATMRRAFMRDSPFLVAATCSAEGLTFEIQYLNKVGFKISQDRPDVLGASREKPYVAVSLSINGEEKYTMYGAPGSQTNQVTVTAQSQDDAAAFKSAAGMAKVFGIDAGVVLSIAEIYSAERITMRFPLENGESPAWQFEPHNPMFRKFGSSCNAILPRLGFGARNTAENAAAEPAPANPLGPLGGLLDALTGKANQPEQPTSQPAAPSTETAPSPVLRGDQN